jgi:hypothetical protein
MASPAAKLSFREVLAIPSVRRLWMVIYGLTAKAASATAGS